jgi:hypothetical protein
MKHGIVFSVGVCAFIFLTFARPVHANSGRFVKINISLANIYEFLDPKSNIIRIAKEGDRFEMVFEGTSWYQIKVQDKVGWLEKNAGTVVSGSAGSNAGTWIVIMVLFLGTLSGAYFYIYKQKSAEV